MSDSEKPGSALEAVEAASAAADDVVETGTEQDDSSSSEASSTEDDQQLQPDSTAEAPTEPLSEEHATPEGIPGTGAIPVDRHKAVLTKARREREEAVAALQQEYDTYRQRVSWAEEVDQAQYARQAQLVQELSADPIAFYQKFQRELEAHPHLGPQLKQGSQKFELPQPALVSETGQQVYSVEQLQQIREHDQQTLRAEMAQHIQAIEARQAQQEQIEYQRQAVTHAATQSQDIMSRLRQDSVFKENEQAVGKRFAALPDDVVRRVGAEAAVEMAYRQFLTEDYLPKIRKASKAETLTTLNKKAAAGSVDPTSAGASAAQRPKGQKGLAAWMEQQSKTA